MSTQRKSYNEVEVLDALNRFIERRHYLITVLNREDVPEEMKEEYRKEFGELVKRHEALDNYAHRVATQG